MQRTALNSIHRRLLGAAVLALTLTGHFVPDQAMARANNSETAGLCEAAANRQERQQRIPNHLLRAIAAVESGRWDAATRANIAWPWTVTAKGKGRFLPSKEAAIRAVQTLQRQGVTNIDVGCMQINLGYHADAFDTLEEAFEPAKNVAYAALFLTELHKAKRSWTSAVRFYHSSDPRRQRHYGRKIYAAQRAIRASGRQRGKTATPLNRVTRNASPPHSAGSTWPPRGYRAQRRMELAARAWAFKGRRR
jgi:hypothetical protein